MADINNKSKSGHLPVLSSTQKASESEKWDLSENKKTPVPTTVTAGTATSAVPMESRENANDRGEERADAYVTRNDGEGVKSIARLQSIESVQVKIEPDVIRVDSTAEFTTLHNVCNIGDMPVVFRVKVTSPSLFRVRPVTGQVPSKGNAILKVTRLANAPLKSDRFDVEFMPLVPEFTPRKKWTPVLPDVVADANVIESLDESARNYALFAINYKPVVRCIRYRAAPPWSTFLTQLENCSNFALAPALEDACTQAGLRVENHLLSLSEFIILNLALRDVK